MELRRRRLPLILRVIFQRNLLLAIPSIAAAAGLIVWCFNARAASRSNSQLFHYEQLVQKADNTGDHEVAELYLRKLISRLPDSPQYKFLLAKTVAAMGDNSRSLQILRQLAPVDGTGYGPAHLIFASQMAAQKRVSFADLEIIKHHAEQALYHNADDPEAHGLLGFVYARSDNRPAAISHLAIAAEHLQRYRMPLARLQIMEGNPTAARNAASRAAGGFLALLKDDPADIDSRLGYAKSMLFLEDYAAVENTLRESSTALEDPRVKKILVDIYLKLWDVLDRNGDTDITRRVRIMQAVVDIDPDHPELLQHIASLVVSTDQELDKARTVLRRALTDGRATSSVHMILGMAALRAANISQAEFHLNQALRLEPNSGRTLGALALTYARMEPPRIRESRQLLDSIHEELFEDDALLLGIRGQILTAAGKHREALPHLERSLELLPGTIDVREAIGVCYDALGEKQIAAYHREVVANKPTLPKFEPLLSNAEARMISRSQQQLTGRQEGQRSTDEAIKQANHIVSQSPSVRPQRIRRRELFEGTNTGHVRPRVREKFQFQRSFYLR